MKNITIVLPVFVVSEMHPELRRNRPPFPVLHVIHATDARLQIRVDHCPPPVTNIASARLTAQADGTGGHRPLPAPHGRCSTKRTSTSDVASGSKRSGKRRERHDPSALAATTAARTRHPCHRPRASRSSITAPGCDGDDFRYARSTSRDSGHRHARINTSRFRTSSTAWISSMHVLLPRDLADNHHGYNRIPRDRQHGRTARLR